MIECGVLNRLRGTGVLKHFGTIRIGEYSIEVKLVWNHVYAVYLGVIVGVLGGWIVGVCVAIAYLVGESKGWGEWVGALTSNQISEQDLERNYNDKEGKTFPYIHQITNFICKERINSDLTSQIRQYKRYASLALFFRGMYWWTPIYMICAYFGQITYSQALLLSLIIGILFPLSCYIGKMYNYSGQILGLKYSGGWENQEIVYGLFQGIIIWYILLN